MNGSCYNANKVELDKKLACDKPFRRRCGKHILGPSLSHSTAQRCFEASEVRDAEWLVVARAVPLDEKCETVWTDGSGSHSSNPHFRRCGVGYYTDTGESVWLPLPGLKKSVDCKPKRLVSDCKAVVSCLHALKAWEVEQWKCHYNHAHTCFEFDCNGLLREYHAKTTPYSDTRSRQLPSRPDWISIQSLVVLCKRSVAKRLPA
eukprot:5886583-Amphidinium_carterae.1